MIRQRIWKNLCKRKDTFKAENAQVCSMHFNYRSYKRGLEHELLNLTPRKNKNRCSTKSATSYSTIPKPEDQCDKKFSKICMNQHPFKLPAEGNEEAEQTNGNQFIDKETDQKNKAIWIQTEHSLFLENTDNLKAELKKTKADLCKQKVRGKHSHKETRAT
ncbi:unnamed protein product [Lepeophtheirus salmonis]|uniref:(salmon louse) hypothetical protein n=1 Tax=Lepeophtheirus salmonis TaxID=72036 RepID=A0A817FDE3_LEPSM|nr:unnamed protein product [Lepeophtheirus salmonis]